MTAKIGLQDVRFHAPHGFFEEEHRMGNEFSIDVEVEASIGGAAEDDDLGGTVNYATIYYLLQLEMKKPTLLLEALAYRMASRILNQFDSVSSVTLKLRKMNPPLGGKVGAASVEITVGAGGSAGGYTGGINSQHTYEDGYGSNYDDDDDDDGPFGRGGGGGGGMRGLVKPPPSPVAAPPMVFDDDAFDDDDELDEDDYDDDDDDMIGDDFLSDEELAAMIAGEGDYDEEDFDEDDYEEGDYDEDDFPDDMDFDNFDFGALGLPDYDPDDTK